jgi:hypothetical protein
MGLFTGANWVGGFIIPIIEIVIIGGIVLTIAFFVVKGFHNAWTKQTKFFFKYKIKRKNYPETTVKWCIDCIDKGIGYYDAKKMLMIKMVEQDQVNETMFIYDQILNELKGGMNKDGREFKGSDRKTQSKATKLLPTIE